MRVRSIRAGTHADYDRVVFEFERSLPGYQIEFVDHPVRHCASDMEIPLGGQAWLQIRMQPAQAHDEAGEVTVGKLRQKPSLPVVKELAQTCDFEGEVTWVAALQAPHKYRVLELQDPPRLVVDIQK